MGLNSLQIEIATAYSPIVREVSGGRNTVVETQIQTELGVELAYVKFLSFENLAKEALCAVLAKYFYLPVRQPYYVNVNNLVPPYKRPNSENLAFGVDKGLAPSFHLRTNQAESELLNWEDLIRCGVFDEWIGNTDRYPNRSLSFEKSGQFWIFDHDDAFPSFLAPNASCDSKLLSLAARNKTEFELHQIKQTAIKFIDEINKISWKDIKNHLNLKDVHEIEPYIEKYIQFLKDRAGYLINIIELNIGLKQLDLISGNNKLKDIKDKSNET